MATFEEGRWQTHTPQEFTHWKSIEVPDPPRSKAQYMNDRFTCPELKSYKTSKAASYVKKAYALITEVDDMNPEAESYFKNILEYCGWLSNWYKQRININKQEI